jgi:hypothetical protein
MPFKIGWLDEKLHIYDIVLSDPFTLTDQDQFFAEFFKFMDAGPVPMYGVFDVSRWSQSGAAGLNDPRFRKMGDYRKKIVVIVMVTKNKVTAAMGRLGAAVVGYRDWMRFEESRETAIKYLQERAATDMAQRGLLPVKPAQAPQGQQAPPVTTLKEQAPPAQVAKDRASTDQAVKVQAPKEQVVKVQASPEQAVKAQAPKEPAAKEQAPKEPAAKEQAPKETEPKDQAPKTKA